MSTNSAQAAPADGTGRGALDARQLRATALAALLLPLGAIGDRLGRKPMLIAGLVVFGVADIVSGTPATVRGIAALHRLIRLTEA